MSILANAKQDFRDKLSGGLKMIEVPEWGDGDKPARIYYKPKMTLAEKGRVLTLQQQRLWAESLVEAIIIRSLDENGKPLFTRVSRRELLDEVDPDIIATIVSRMNGDDDDTDDDISLVE